jgi:hypothetical protein
MTDHWMVAFLPVAGLLVSVILHVILVWLGVVGRHLGPLIVSALVYWTAVAAVLWQFVPNLSSPDRIGTVILAVLSGMALSYCYFTFVNLTATSLRIRLVRMLLNAPELGGMPERMAAGYTIADIVDIRIGRLKAWGYLSENDERMVLLRRPMFYWIGIIVAILRSILGIKRQAN